MKHFESLRVNVWPHLQHLWYLLCHKWYVLVFGIKLHVPLWQLLIHDWTKILPIEWVPYTNRFYINKVIQKDKYTGDDDNAFQLAWQHHWSSNPHHPEFWWMSNTRNILVIAHEVDVDDQYRRLYETSQHEINTSLIRRFNQGDSIEDIARDPHLCIPMPRHYALEMIADWFGASYAKGKKSKEAVLSWYEQNKERIHLHPTTRTYVKEILSEFCRS